MYRFIDGISMADVAFEASAPSFEELLCEAGKATTQVMVKDIATVELTKSVPFKLQAKSEEMLLFNFLQEIIFFKDAKMLLLKEFDFKITQKKNTFYLLGKAKGEKLDMKKHELLVDVKAVSMHMFELKKEKNGYRCFVILDI